MASPLQRRILDTLLAASMAAALLSVGLPAVAPSQAVAQETERGASGLPLPRFVSLRANRVNLRVGPGTNYAVDWMYTRSGLPMEIVQEYDNWRRVRDWEGAEGWINQSLLSGARTGIVAPWQQDEDAQVALKSDASHAGRTVALLEPGVIGTIHMCNGDWCDMTFAGNRGFIVQSQIWGAYPGETYED